MKSPPTTVHVFALRASRGARAGLWLIHVVALCLLMWASVSRPLLGVAVPIVIALAWWQDQRLQLRDENAICRLRFDAAGWSIATAGSDWWPVRWLPATTVTAVAIVLVWAPSRWRRRHILITPSMVGADDYRTLCRLLWQAAEADGASTAAH